MLFGVAKRKSTLTFDELLALATDIGASITHGKGSQILIRLELDDAEGRKIYADTINPGGITWSAHQPHGRQKDNKRALPYVVKLFRNAFERAGITWERLFEAHQKTLESPSSPKSPRACN